MCKRPPVPNLAVNCKTNVVGKGLVDTSGRKFPLSLCRTVTCQQLGWV
ncbi:hypothetical protein RB213_003406 [Colletotrichum asianum]